jgi:hypothetical protein
MSLRVNSLYIMKDDAKSMTVPGTQTAYAVPQVDAIRATRPLHWAMMYGKRDRITLAKRNHLRPRLHARALFSQYKFPARKILFRLGQQDRYLYRKDVLAVEILMQAIVVTLPILQQQWRRPQLPGIMTSPDEVGVTFRVPDFIPHCGVPAIRSGREPLIEGYSQVCDDLGQRITEVLVFAAPKAMPRHHDAASKEAILWIELSQCLALVRRQDAFEQRAPSSVEILRDMFPVERFNSGQSIAGRNYASNQRRHVVPLIQKGWAV